MGEVIAKGEMPPLQCKSNLEGGAGAVVGACDGGSRLDGWRQAITFLPPFPYLVLFLRLLRWLELQHFSLVPPTTLPTEGGAGGGGIAVAAGQTCVATVVAGAFAQTECRQ